MVINRAQKRDSEDSETAILTHTHTHTLVSALVRHRVLVLLTPFTTRPGVRHGHTPTGEERAQTQDMFHALVALDGDSVACTQGTCFKSCKSDANFSKHLLLVTFHRCRSYLTVELTATTPSTLFVCFGVFCGYGEEGANKRLDERCRGSSGYSLHGGVDYDVETPEALQGYDGGGLRQAEGKVEHPRRCELLRCVLLLFRVMFLFLVVTFCSSHVATPSLSA